jgi:hypothetical protein
VSAAGALDAGAALPRAEPVLVHVASAAEAVGRAGANGEVFGVGLAGEPGHWHRVPATPPQGWRWPAAPAGAAGFTAGGARPLVCLAMVGADGTSGWLGRGVWPVPAEAFGAALGRRGADGIGR